MTKRELQVQLVALRAERDELKAGLIDAVALLVQLAAVYPHEERGECLHCAHLARALELGRPLERYTAEIQATKEAFAREHPERYAELRRGIFGGAPRGGPAVAPAAGD